MLLADRTGPVEDDGEEEVGDCGERETQRLFHSWRPSHVLVPRFPSARQPIAACEWYRSIATWAHLQATLALFLTGASFRRSFDDALVGSHGETTHG